MFNRSHNSNLERIKLLLEIDYNATNDAQTIQSYLQKISTYESLGLFGFALPVAVFLALEKEAVEHECNCSEWLLHIHEKQLDKRITVELERGEKIETNLVSAKSYGNQHERSVGQAKQYCKKGRVEGGIKLGWDWLIPRDAKLPENLHGKRRPLARERWLCKDEETVCRSNHTDFLDLDKVNTNKTPPLEMVPEEAFFNLFGK